MHLSEHMFNSFYDSFVHSNAPAWAVVRAVAIIGPAVIVILGLLWV